MYVGHIIVSYRSVKNPSLNTETLRPLYPHIKIREEIQRLPFLQTRRYTGGSEPVHIVVPYHSLKNPSLNPTTFRSLYHLTKIREEIQIPLFLQTRKIHWGL